MNNDLISREALKKTFAEYGETAKFTQGACQQLFDNAPTVDLTENQAYDKGFITAMKLYSRPQGEWIDQSYDYGYVECPFCHKATNCVDNIDELHFCWNCGANMKGGAE